jgi:hypothetical protein
MMRAVVLLIGVMFAGCNEEKLPLYDTGVKPPDQRLDTSVKPPDQRAPDACLAANPVRILFVVDTSGSMQLTDTKTLRQSAVSKLYQALHDKKNVEYEIISYNTRAAINGASSISTFTLDVAVINFAIAQLASADVLSDLQNALTTVIKAVSDDMKKATDLATTRYVVILLTDGGTGPVCAAGCGNDPMSLTGECTGGACGTPSRPGHDSGPVMDASVGPMSWCDLPRSQWCSVYQPTSCANMTSWFPAMTAECLEYNTEQLLVAKVKELMALKAQYKAGAVQLHTARLIDPTTPSAQLTLMGIDPAKAETFLRKLATEGGGSYLDLYGGEDLTKLPVESLCP